MPIQRQCTMPSVTTMGYKFHIQVNNPAGSQTQRPKLTKWHSPKAKRIVLLWDAQGDFLSWVVKTKLPEELRTKFRLFRAASIHNLAFLAHHYYSRHSESSGDIALCSAYLAETKTHLRLPKNTNTLWLSQLLPLLLLILAALFLLTGNWENRLVLLQHVYYQSCFSTAMRKRRFDCFSVFIMNCHVKLYVCSE